MNTEKPGENPEYLSDYTNGEEYEPERVARRIGQDLQLIIKDAIESSNTLAGYMLDLKKSIKEAQDTVDEEAIDSFHEQLLEFEEEVAKIKDCMTKCFEKYIKD